MEHKDNQIKVQVKNTSNGLHISTPNVKQAISATNNRAEQYADLAKKYKDEAKKYRDDALYYTQQNSDVTVEYIETIKMNLENKIYEQCTGLKTDLQNQIPQNVGELNNDVPYIKKNEFNDVVKDLELPSQEGCKGKFLCTDGQKEFWEEIPSSFNMFDTRLSDHVLTYEESKGWGLQGTYVYKEALAGSRYGYEDFYNKCLEEYNNSSSVKTYIKSNITRAGSLIDNKGVLRGFSASNYATIPNIFTPASQSWEIVVKAKTSDLSAINNILGAHTAFKTGAVLYIDSSKLNIALSSNGTSYNIVAVGKAIGTHTLSADTIYYFKLEFTGTAYNVYYSTNGTSWTLDITVTSSVAIVQSEAWSLGGGVIGGTSGYYNTASVDLNGSYIKLNGKNWWNGVDNLEYKKHSNGHLFYAITNKSKVDEYFNLYGSAWLYGVDEANKRILLPRNDYFEQVTAKSAEVGKTVEAGLPNITGTLANTYDSNATGQTGAFYNGNIVANGSFGFDGNSHDCARATHLDASRSNSIYGASNTVQPNAVKKLLYICVGNTTNYEGITDVVNQGMSILEQVNQGIESRIESRIKLDGSNAEFPYITETYVNGTSWYRVYSDGWCEQGGGTSGEGSALTATLLKNYVDTNYGISIQTVTTGTNTSQCNTKATSMTNSGFKITKSSDANFGFKWMAWGYLA